MTDEVRLAAASPPSKPLRPPASGVRPGQLVIVGSGIRAVGQFTLEAQGHIREADKVFYCVADPVTERWIEEQNPNAYDLYRLYGNGKMRQITYAQMAEILLAHVRLGYRVVGVFYGHPGVFVNPSHRAIAIAREEGHEARMLPGVSAEDCLYADLGIDPSRVGCQIFEATDLLLRRRTLLPDSHVILFQVGSVGDMGFNFGGFENRNFGVLVDRLEEAYGGEHVLTHYVAPQYPAAAPVIERLKVSDLRDPSVARRVTGISTFYIPPAEARVTDAGVAERLGIANPSTRPVTAGPYNVSGVPYGDFERTAVRLLASHQDPAEYVPNRGGDRLYRLLSRMAVSPRLQEVFRRNPPSVTSAFGLSPAETRAVTAAAPWGIRAALKQTPATVANQFVQAELRNPQLAIQFQTVLKQNNGKPNGDAVVSAWLKSKGYDVTPQQVIAAYQAMINVSLGSWASVYNLFVDGKAGPVLVITQAGQVTLGGAPVTGLHYANSVLTWQASTSSAYSAVLNFQLLTNANGQRLPAGSYIGPQCYGKLWARGAQEPAQDNAFGKVNVYSPQSATTRLATDPLSTWNGTYQAQLAATAGNWQPAGTLVISAAGSTSTVTYNGAAIQKFTFANNQLSWTSSDGNPQSVSVLFFSTSAPTASNPTTGPQFYGKLWPAGGSPPSQGNFYGSVQHNANPAGGAAQGASVDEWRTVGINLGVGIATLLVGMGVMKAIEAAVAAVKARLAKAPAAEQQQLENEASQAEESANEEIGSAEEVSSEAAEASPELPSVPGELPPAQAADAAEAAAAEAAAAEAAAAEAAAAEAAAAAAAEAAAADAAAVAAADVAAADVVADVVVEVIL